jgi:hypothetical protein
MEPQGALGMPPSAFASANVVGGEMTSSRMSSGTFSSPLAT